MSELQHDIDKLPAEISTTTFARFAQCGTTTVWRMIRQNVIPARVVNPASRKPTYRIPTWALRAYLGLSEPEPEYQSKLLAGKL